jgi:hypothetical protein
VKVRQLIALLLNYDLDSEVKMSVGSTPMAHIENHEMATDPDEPEAGPVLALKAD